MVGQRRRGLVGIWEAAVPSDAGKAPEGPLAPASEKLGFGHRPRACLRRFLLTSTASTQLHTAPCPSSLSYHIQYHSLHILRYPCPNKVLSQTPGTTIGRPSLTYRHPSRGPELRANPVTAARRYRGTGSSKGTSEAHQSRTTGTTCRAQSPDLGVRVCPLAHNDTYALY